MANDRTLLVTGASGQLAAAIISPRVQSIGGIDGEHVTTLRGTYDELATAFRELVDNYIETKYPRR